MPEFRDWAFLPELPLEEVLRRVLPCLRSVYAFAAVCRPWRRLTRACAAALLRPRLPPLLLDPAPRRVDPFSLLVLAEPIDYRADLRAEGDTLLSASRGHLLLRRRGPSEARIVIIDALTGAERRELALPSPRFAYHFAALSPSHLLAFHSKHAFFSHPFPNPNTDPNWTKHSLPRSASFVTGVLEFRGRVLGLTDCAQLLEFRLGASSPSQVVRMLPAAGLPKATTFDRWHFGPHLAAAGDRLLLVLFMLNQATRRVKKLAVYSLDMAEMRWDEVNDMGAYSLFVDCAGKSAAACLDVGSCQVKKNGVYVTGPGCRFVASFRPGWEAPQFGGPGVGSAVNELFTRSAMRRLPWPSKIWVYPQLFF